MKAAQTKRFRFKRGGTLLGEVTLEPAKSDFPWFAGTFVASEAFEEVRSLFEASTKLLDEDRVEEWDRLWQSIVKPGLTLEDRDSPEVITSLLIHIEGREVRWRS